ncbi:CbtB-domain containing protein [Streptomyces sp. NPDC088400]|uniref:CbtB domain-containing protein n=1 Tax=Streptomyces sp. NPDC088400 TaxID=3365861 RepID=UPI0037F74E78|nr:CbtB-domain containing protein [Streptomyces sp. NBC_00857]
MAQSIAPPAVSPTATPVAPIPLRAVLPWAVFVGTLMLVLLYFVGAEQGATSVFSGAGVHEWVHDGRHLLGFPCH